MGILPNEASKDIWDMIKKNVPFSIIIAIIIYCAIIGGAIYVYKTITDNEKISSEMYLVYTRFFVIVWIILTVILVVIIILCFVKYRKNKKKISEAPQTSEMPQGKVEAYIVKQNEASRDNKFIEINQNVKKSYWVLGVGLTSIVNHEATLEKMASDKVDIRLCMMNPDIAINDLYANIIEKNESVFIRLFEEVKSGNIRLEDVKKRVTDKDKCKDLLEIYHVLINAIHFNEYYATATNYKEIIGSSLHNLLAIKANIDKKYGNGHFNLKLADSFIPISMTISDASEDSGRMIVEFHLPFTKYKVLFELCRGTNAKLFNVFLDFYINIWERANNE